MEKITAEVARQYTDFAYPKPFDDIAEAVAAGHVELCDPSLFGWQFWPEGAPEQPLDILVAGCGTQQAALIAYRNPTARVVGVDLSEVSLAHQRYLAEKAGLTNLELFQGDLCEVSSLGRDFDLVISSGVLHHLADPSAGLRALRDVLRPEGAMPLMVYGRVRRTGVYMVQDAFRRLGLGRDAEGVARGRAIVDRLPEHHFVRQYTALAEELAFDPGFVDTFLHAQDRAYTVPELLAWVEGEGLAFQGWLQNQLYHPEVMLDPVVAGEIVRLPAAEQWAVTEALACIHGVHTFVLRHPGRAVRPDFAAGDGWLDYRPGRHPGAEVAADVADDGSGEARLWGNPMPLTAAERWALLQVDGRRTIGDLAAHESLAGFPEAERRAFLRAAFERFWRMSVVMLRL